VCDVDAARVKVAADLIDQTYGNRDCRRSGDFRELLADAGLDTLCIAVPDHWHGALSVAALRAGKDIYGEKPLALTVAEGQAIVRAVRRHGRVWETGSWQRSTGHFRHGCELVRNGRIGRLERVEVGIGTGPTIEPQPVMPVPPGLDYDLWLGPAPWAPYTEKRVHWNFRWILDYSGGQVTDWGAHHIDIAQWGMGTDDTGPEAVEGIGDFPAEGLYDAATHYRFECTYANGVTLVVGSNDKVRQGVRFIGDRGWVHITRSRTTTEPSGLVRETIGPNEIHLAKPHGDHRQGHRRDFLDCVRSRAETITPVEVGHRSITIAHLGNIAMLLGRRVRWDPRRERIVGDAGAERMTARSLRGPWRV
jgi:predicted dehydrogenase